MVVPAIVWIIAALIRRLNSATTTDIFPLPQVDNSLDQLSNSQYFTTFDLAAGYWQVLVDPKSHEKTAFVTHSGLFEFSELHYRMHPQCSRG